MWWRYELYIIIILIYWHIPCNWICVQLKWNSIQLWFQVHRCVLIVLVSGLWLSATCTTQTCTTQTLIWDIDWHGLWLSATCTTQTCTTQTLIWDIDWHISREFLRSVAQNELTKSFSRYGNYTWYFTKSGNILEKNTGTRKTPLEM